MNRILRITALSVLLLFGATACFGGGTSESRLPPRSHAALKTFMVLGLLRLKVHYPEHVKAAKAAATAFAQGLRLVAAENNLLDVKAAIDKALLASGVNKEELHPEAQFWLDAMPELAAIYADEEGKLNKEALLKLADKVEEYVGKV